MSGLLNDLRFALRQLRRSPGFALTAVLTLALGIGATTAMYSLVRNILLEPLPYPQPQDLVGIGFLQPGEAPAADQTGDSADFLMRHATGFSSMGIFDEPQGQNFSVGSGKPIVVRAQGASAGYLPTLGAFPVLGRIFTADEDRPGAAHLVVLSNRLWRSALRADPHVIGRVVRINAEPFTVIGVMPARFATVDSPDLWHPLQMSTNDPGYFGQNYELAARLRPGVSLAQAQDELDSLTAGLYRHFPQYVQYTQPGSPQLHEFVWPLSTVVASESKPSLIALSFAVVVVLLIACLNLAGLMTARAAARRQEIAVRATLGASASAVLRLLMSESVLLAVSGSVLGLLVAHWTAPLLLREAPIDLPKLHTVTLNLPVTLFALVLGCATTLLFGLLPAVAAFRASLGTLANARTTGDSASRQRLGRALLVAQMALATVLLSTGGVLLGTFLKLHSLSTGVRAEHLDVLQVNLKGAHYAHAATTEQFITAVEQGLRQIPGVMRVAAANGVPLDRGLNAGAYPAGHPELRHTIETRFITPGYFNTVGTPFLAGNDISATDTEKSQPVAVINDVAARRWFGGRSALGEFVVAGGGSPRRVVGIVASAQGQTLGQIASPTIYVPFAQINDGTAATINGWFATSFMLRILPEASVDEPRIAQAAAATIASVDPNVAVGRYASMQSLVDRSVAAPRFFTWLSGAFGGFALLLTMIGLFGLMNYQVASRTREIGVRIAVGANKAQILNMILSRAIVLTAIGACAGMLISLCLRPALASIIANAVNLDVHSLAPVLGGMSTALAAAAVAMLLSALAASILPAQRAASIEPTEALRAE